MPARAATPSNIVGLQQGEAEEVAASLQARFTSHNVQQQANADAANVLIKYLVPPPVQQEFIEVFQNVKDETKKEEGCEDYYLLKPITDNITYYIIGRWSSAEAYTAHFQADYTKRLLEFDTNKGIVFYIQPFLIVD